jgi:serine/threonine-protein kinase PpkA
MVKVKCSQFGNCPLADGAVHELASMADHDCELRREGGQCGLAEVKGGGVKMPGLPKPVLIGAAAAVLLGGGGAAAWWAFSAPTCNIETGRSLMALDPKVGELETLGTNCLKAGMKNGNANEMTLAVQALRLADKKGSAIASASLGRLFDPLIRPEVEADAASPDILPATDPRLAAGFYDRAAKLGDAKSKAAVAELRQRYDLPAADGSQAGRDGAPLTLPGYPDIFQRVIAKPGAALATGPEAAGGVAVKPFDLFYVFKRQGDNLQVGRSLQKGPEGWIAGDKAQDWNVMLVMRYAAPGQRRQVLFFRDELSVKSLLAQPGAAETVDGIIASTTAGEPDPRLIAIEDKTVDWTLSPYVMPVLQASMTIADDGRSVTLAQVGSVAGGGAATTSAAATPGVCGSDPALANRHQVVFVIDTTASMGPYIEQVKRLAERWRVQTEARGVADNFRFGIVAYRNNIDDPAQAGLEYVARTVLPLSAKAGGTAFVAAANSLAATPVSTHSFDEDAVAGLKQAVELDWSAGCGLRLMVLITDAGALKSDDPKARHAGVGLSTIAAQAREQNIRTFVAHLATPEARKAGNVEKAAGQYRDAFAAPSGEGYQAISDGSPASFGGYLKGIGPIIDGAAKQKAGTLQAKPVVAEGAVQTITDQVLTELFSVQQRFVGAAAGAQAGTFTDSWTSDRDLADLNREALEVSVYLTRRQLNQLAEQTDRLVRTARQAKMESDKFFGLLRLVSAATAQDPGRYKDDVSRLDAMMPSFLKLLPYKSDVLSMNAEDWRAMGASKQDAFLRRLSEKLQFYRALDSNQSRWKALGDAEKDNQVALVPLRQMP